MMMAVTGETWKVLGRSKAIAAVGPRPGSTPTRVPMRTPRKQKKRFAGVKRIWAPRAMWANISMSLLKPEKAPGQLGFQEINEQKPGAQRAENRHRERSGPALREDGAEE